LSFQDSLRFASSDRVKFSTRYSRTDRFMNEIEVFKDAVS